MKELVRYKNRKLYDLNAHKYVTLLELSHLPKEDYKVTDHETGADVTHLTWLKAQINLLEQPITAHKE